MIVAPIGDCRQSERTRPILQQRVRHRGGGDARQRRHPESPAPAEQGDDRADADEGQAFADRVGRAPDAVAASALAVAVPRRHRHYTAGRAEALEPAVQSPHQRRYPHGSGEAHGEVAERAQQKAGGQKLLHVGVIGEEAVRQLADSIGVEQCGTDEAEVGGAEDAGIDERFLDDAEREAAGVDDAVAERDREHHAQAMAAVKAVDGRGVRELRLIRTGREVTPQRSCHIYRVRSAGATVEMLVPIYYNNGIFFPYGRFHEIPSDALSESPHCCVRGHARGLRCR